MATFKAVVSPYRKADGTYRVNIRVTNNRQHKDIPTPFYVTSEQITRSMKIKDQTILDAVEDRIREYRLSATKMGFLAEKLDIDHFVKLLNTNNENLDFFTFARKYIERVRKEGRDGTADMYKWALSSIERYNKNKPLYFSCITKRYMLGYFESIRHLKSNTQVNYIGKIKAMYNAAISEYNNSDLGIIVVRSGVFDLIKLPEKESAKDNAIKTVEQMQALIDEPYTGRWVCDLSKDMFILAFCCFGTNIADFMRMKKDQYKDGILYYRRKKTALQSKERADMEIRVPEVGRIILEKYSGDKEYLISFGHHNRTNSFVQYIHYFFHKIGLEEWPEGQKIYDSGRYKVSKYTFYANRHSMASFAINVCGIDYMTVHQMLNHATPSNFKTTDAYIWRDFSPLWEANEKLMSLFDWSFYLNQKKD